MRLRFRGRDITRLAVARRITACRLFAGSLQAACKRVSTTDPAAECLTLFTAGAPGIHYSPTEVMRVKSPVHLLRGSVATLAAVECPAKVARRR